MQESAKRFTIQMKKKFIKWLSAQDFIYNLSVKLIANRIVHGENHLKPSHLIARGWVKEDDYYFEPDVKDKCKIWVKFENHYFRIYYGVNKTFIGLESKIEWFDNYYLLAHGDNGRYNLAGV